MTQLPGHEHDADNGSWYFVGRPLSNLELGTRLPLGGNPDVPTRRNLVRLPRVRRLEPCR